MDIDQFGDLYVNGVNRAGLVRFAKDPAPSDGLQGEWVLALGAEELFTAPMRLIPVGLVAMDARAPISEVEDALRIAGYTVKRAVSTGPWIAEWDLT